MPDADGPPEAHIVHALPGRTRLIVPARRGDAAFFADRGAALARLPGVTATGPNPRAGSIVVHHQGDFASVAAAAEAAGLLRVAALRARVAPRSRRRPRRVPPMMLAAGGLAGLGAVQVLRGRIAGNAVEALWNAYQARRRLGMPRLSRLLVGVGLLQLARGEVLGPGVSLLFYALVARQMARSVPPPRPAAVPPAVPAASRPAAPTSGR